MIFMWIILNEFYMGINGVYVQYVKSWTWKYGVCADYDKEFYMALNGTV